MADNLFQLKKAPRSKNAPRKPARARDSVPAVAGEELPKQPKPGRKQTKAELRRTLIAQAAYFRAERRGFAAGYELQDWCEAEAEIDARFPDLAAPGRRARKTT